MPDLDPALPPSQTLTPDPKPSQAQTKGRQPLSLAQLLDHYPALHSATQGSHSANIILLAALLKDIKDTKAAFQLNNIFVLLNGQVAIYKAQLYKYHARLDRRTSELYKYCTQLNQRSAKLCNA